MKLTNKFTVLLPVEQHNKLSNLEVIDVIKAEVSKQTGGFTTLPVRGGWYDTETGVLYNDESVLLYTYAENDQLSRLLSLCNVWAVQLKQISLMVEVSPVYVEFVEGTREQDLGGDTEPLLELTGDMLFPD